MQKEKLIITIPKPCSENWDEMTFGEKGRFCASCQKTVIDFTALTDAEIVNTIRSAGNSPICGHYHISQLNREIVKYRHVGSFGTTFIKRIAASLLFFQTTVAATWAQQVKPKMQLQAKPAGGEKKGTAKTRKIKGSIIDFVTKEPLQGITVTIKGTAISAVSSKNGTFILLLPGDFHDTTIKLQAEYIAQSGNDPGGTIILDKEVTVNDQLFAGDIMLYRYPLERLEPAVVTGSRIKLVDSEIIKCFSTGDSWVTEQTLGEYNPKPWKKDKWFRKRHKTNE